MNKLIIQGTGGESHDFHIKKERVIIGRRPECDLLLNDVAASGRHAMIITIMDDSFLEDMGSTNGTIVNGEQIKKHPLRNGDSLLIGRSEMKFVAEDEPEKEEEFERTVMIKPSSAIAAATAAKLTEQAGGGPTPLPTPGDDHSAAAGRSVRNARLSVLSGPSSGKFMFLTKALVTLGKPGKQVAAISRRAQGYYLTHIESDGDGKRYPVVNGKSIGPSAYPLKDEDLLELAGIRLKFSMKSEAS